MSPVALTGVEAALSGEVSVRTGVYLQIQNPYRLSKGIGEPLEVGRLLIPGSSRQPPELLRSREIGCLYEVAPPCTCFLPAF